jgi:hypothetical protein
LLVEEERDGGYRIILDNRSVFASLQDIVDFLREKEGIK